MGGMKKEGLLKTKSNVNHQRTIEDLTELRLKELSLENGHISMGSPLLSEDGHLSRFSRIAHTFASLCVPKVSNFLNVWLATSQNCNTSLENLHCSVMTKMYNKTLPTYQKIHDMFISCSLYCIDFLLVLVLPVVLVWSMYCVQYVYVM